MPRCADDTFEVSALLTQVRLKAELGVQSDLTSLEVIDLGAATGADRITVNDLSGTDTVGVVVDLGPPELKVDTVTVNGTAGADAIQAKATSMTGSGADERFVVSPIGGRTILTRDVANVRMDMDDLERLDVMPAGGADTTHVDDMSGTDTKVVTWELAPFRGTTASDGSQDSVTVNGSNGNDNITVTAAGQQVRVAGLATVVEVNRADKCLDTLFVDTRFGSDSIFIAPEVHDRLKFSSA